MEFLIILYFSLFGLIVGSFLNVFILRYNTGKSLSGRSGCFSCGHALSWYELIPVGSYVFQRGRCRHCGSKISKQYPLVEILTALLFGLTAWKFYPAFLPVIFYCLIMSILVVVVVYDLKHKIIPDGPVYALIVLTILSPQILNWSTSSEISLTLLSNIAGGAVIFLFFFCLWYFSRGRAMGFGDAKLGFAIGALLGLYGAVNAVALAFWIGAIVGLSLVALGKLRKFKAFKRKFTAKSEIPFAPFLALGLALNLFFGLSVLVF